MVLPLHTLLITLPLFGCVQRPDSNSVSIQLDTPSKTKKTRTSIQPQPFPQTTVVHYSPIHFLIHSSAVPNSQHRYKTKQQKTQLIHTLTFEVLGAAHKLDAREQRNAARQQHGEAAHLHAALLARSRSRLVPAAERPAARRIMNVIEEAAFRHEECVRLEWSLCSCWARCGDGSCRRQFCIRCFVCVACGSRKLTQTTERLNPSLSALAFGRVHRALTAPVADFLVVRRLHDVGDVTAGIHLFLRKCGRKQTR